MVLGSIPGVVTGYYSDIFPSDRTMALGSTQPLVKMSTRIIPGGKGGRCVRLTTSSPSRAECHEIWEPKPPGNLWATPGQLRDSFTFTCFPSYNEPINEPGTQIFAGWYRILTLYQPQLRSIKSSFMKLKLFFKLAGKVQDEGQKCHEANDRQKKERNHCNRSILGLAAASGC
jgi:hypothetical protein